MTRKDGSTITIVKVGVFDNSEDASISLYGVTASSTSGWKPSKTVLLLTKPGYRASSGRWLSLNSDSLVDVDPDIPDAAWLRGFADRLVKREHVNPAFPQEGINHRPYEEDETKRNLVNVEEIANAPIRVLYSLAELDQK